MLVSLDDFVDKDALDVESCKGRIYKCKVSTYLDGRGNYTQKVSMDLQKRKSCKGCAKCGWIDDALTENLACGEPPIINTYENNALYTLRSVNEKRDWETGYIDSFDLEYIKL